MQHVFTRVYTYKISVGTPKGKNYLEDVGVKREDNIKMNPKEIQWKAMDWSQV
jgi:hypothetical protein